jgi:ADP-heptose:LPS heptosyltransferase
VSQGKILVIRGGAIGDFILTLPAVAALRKQFPRTHIEVLGYPQVAALAKLAGYANEVRSIEARAMAGFFASRGDLDAALSRYFGEFNIVLSYLYDPDLIFHKNVARASEAQFIVGPHRPNEKEDVHATEVFLRPLERLAIFGASATPYIPIEVKRQPTAPRTLAVHPGSGSEKKNWPEAHWEEFLRLVVSKTDWRLLLVGGEAEEERLQRLATMVPIERLRVARHLPLTELAERLAHCDAFLGHDSGISHLAAAVGLRGVVLWGETKAAIWRPRSDQFTLVQSPAGLEKLSCESVFAAARAAMLG